MDTCKTCDNIISLDADACPNCGSKSNMTWSSWILAIIVVVSGLLYYGGGAVSTLKDLARDLGENPLLMFILICCGIFIWSRYRRK